jgi:hypothetical protein
VEDVVREKAAIVLASLFAFGCMDGGSPRTPINPANNAAGSPHSDGGAASDGDLCTVAMLKPLVVCALKNCLATIIPTGGGGLNQQAVVDCLLANCEAQIAGISPGCIACIQSAASGGGASGDGGLGGIDLGGLGASGGQIGQLGGALEGLGDIAACIKQQEQ